MIKISDSASASQPMLTAIAALCRLALRRSPPEISVERSPRYSHCLRSRREGDRCESGPGSGGGSEEEEEAGVSSPYNAVSSVIGKRGGSERDVQNGEENEMERDSWRGISDEYDDVGSRKKLRLSKDQSVILEESFKEHNTLNPKQKLALAK